jgi:hypothetical protein
LRSTLAIKKKSETASSSSFLTYLLIGFTIYRCPTAIAMSRGGMARAKPNVAQLGAPNIGARYPDCSHVVQLQHVASGATMKRQKYCLCVCAQHQYNRVCNRSVICATTKAHRKLQWDLQSDRPGRACYLRDIETCATSPTCTTSPAAIGVVIAS